MANLRVVPTDVRLIRVRGRWEYQVNGGIITNDQHIAVSYGRKEDAVSLLTYWLEHGHWLGKREQA